MCRTAKTVGLLAVVLATTTGACDVNAPVYMPSEMGLEVLEGMPSATQTVALEFRRPTAGERDILNQQRQALVANPKFDIPWLKREHISLSLQYTVSNLSKVPARFQILINGANEFTLYNPVAIVEALLAAGEDEDEVYLPSLVETTESILQPGERRSGNVREDDFGEAAADLDAFGRFMGNPIALLIQHSDKSKLGLEMVPLEVVTPQLNQLIITLVASAPVRLDYVIRIRDDRAVLAEDGEMIFNPNPTEFVPAEYGMALMDAMMMMPMPMPMP